jgi:hypothetical protein
MALQMLAIFCAKVTFNFLGPGVDYVGTVR